MTVALKQLNDSGDYRTWCLELQAGDKVQCLYEYARVGI